MTYRQELKELKDFLTMRIWFNTTEIRRLERFLCNVDRRINSLSRRIDKLYRISPN